MITVVNSTPVTRSTQGPVPAAPPPTNEPKDTVRLVGGTIGGAALSATTGVATVAIAAGVTSLLGIPVIGAGIAAGAVGAAGLLGATLAGLTLRNSFSPPAGTEDAFKTGRGDVLSRLPDPPRDAASMVLAENQMWQSLSQARSASSADEAGKIGASGFGRFTTIMVHGGERTASLALGIGIGTALAGPLVGIPLGFAGGFAFSYVLDKPAHWAGEAIGKAIGSVAGRAAYNKAH